jgi:hypothetical protein
MAKRHEWKFEYTSDEVLVGVNVKLKHHRSRYNWWLDKKDEVMKIVREEGLEIDESVAQGYSNSGRGPQVMVRVDLQRDLTECVQKIDEHKRKVAEYESWEEVLRANSQSLKLNQDDWLYFFGKI